MLFVIGAKGGKFQTYKQDGFKWRECQNGQGEESWPDGAVYNGMYVEGKKHGEGRLILGNQQELRRHCS